MYTFPPKSGREKIEQQLEEEQRGQEGTFYKQKSLEYERPIARERAQNYRWESKRLVDQVERNEEIQSTEADWCSTGTGYSRPEETTMNAGKSRGGNEKGRR